MPRKLNGERDAQLTVRRQDGEDKLLIAVSGDNAFVGLDSEEGVFQYVARGNPNSSDGERFMIGGQPTVIDSKYVISVEDAANLSREWAAGERVQADDWERR